MLLYFFGRTQPYSQALKKVFDFFIKILFNFQMIFDGNIIAKQCNSKVAIKFFLIFANTVINKSPAIIVLIEDFNITWNQIHLLYHCDLIPFLLTLR